MFRKVLKKQHKNEKFVKVRESSKKLKKLQKDHKSFKNLKNSCKFKKDSENWIACKCLGKFKNFTESFRKIIQNILNIPRIIHWTFSLTIQNFIENNSLIIFNHNFFKITTKYFRYFKQHISTLTCNIKYFNKINSKSKKLRENKFYHSFQFVWKFTKNYVLLWEMREF